MTDTQQSQKKGKEKGEMRCASLTTSSPILIEEMSLFSSALIATYKHGEIQRLIQFLAAKFDNGASSISIEQISTEGNLCGLRKD